MTKKSLAVAAAALFAASSSFAFTPAVVYDQAGKFDKSFNEAAYTGAERFKKATGVAYREAQIANEAQKEQAAQTIRLSQLAARLGIHTPRRFTHRFQRSPGLRLRQEPRQQVTATRLIQ